MTAKIMQQHASEQIGQGFTEKMQFNFFGGWKKI